MSREAGAPAVDLSSLILPLLVLDSAREEFVRQYQVLPLKVDGAHLFVAMVDPNDEAVKAELSFLSGRQIVAYAAPAAALARTIDEVYQARKAGKVEWRGPRAHRTPLESAIVASSRGSVDASAPMPLRQAELAVAPPAVREPFGEGIGFEQLQGDERHAASQRRPRVLVVDDEQVIGRIVKQALTQRGFEVLSAQTGMEALRLVKDSEPDVILLDAMLPDIHGFDICKRLHDSPRYRHLPIIMMTAVYKGWRMEADIKETYGVAGYIEKPFDIHEVVRQIEAALAGRPAGERNEDQAGCAQARQLYEEASRAYAQGNLEAAAAALTTATTLEPLNAALHHQLGLVQARLGKDFAAIQELEMAVELEPTRFASLRNLAVLYQRRGFRRKACEAWERALAVAPDEPTRQEIKSILVSLL